MIFSYTPHNQQVKQWIHIVNYLKTSSLEDLMRLDKTCPLMSLKKISATIVGARSSCNACSHAYARYDEIMCDACPIKGWTYSKYIPIKIVRCTKKSSPYTKLSKLMKGIVHGRYKMNNRKLVYYAELVLDSIENNWE